MAAVTAPCGAGAGAGELLLASWWQQAGETYSSLLQPPPRVVPEVSGMQNTPEGKAEFDLELLVQQYGRGKVLVHP